MTTTNERHAQILKIRQLPDQLAALVADMNDAQLDFSRGPGDWTTRQVVHHLADSHVNAYIRTKFALTEDHPTFKPYDQEVWAELDDAKTMPLAPSLAILGGLHDRWAHLFESLPEASWSRAGFHPEDGEMTIEHILEHYAWHGENHLRQIQTLREAQGI